MQNVIEISFMEDKNRERIRIVRDDSTKDITEGNGLIIHGDNYMVQGIGVRGDIWTLEISTPEFYERTSGVRTHMEKGTPFLRLTYDVTEKIIS